MAPNFIVPGPWKSKNVNVLEPKQPIYPRKHSSDPVYSLPEERLRGAIRIPKTYSYGKKLPVIFCPGTATPAGISYRFNLYRQLAQSDFADPVLLNIPGTTVGDIQVTAEYYAYAIHYISSTQSAHGDGKVAIIAQSQGCVNAQWALKYWPSARAVTSNFIAISAAFGGTARFEHCRDRYWWLIGAPAILQQMSGSKFVAALRADDGGSAFVPTTSIYTAEDEIIHPQTGRGASGRIGDARGVGVTNVEIQAHCPKDTRAGSSVSHVGVIYCSMTYALVMDALTHRDQGSVGRLDMDAVRKAKYAPGVSFFDVVLTRIGDPISIMYILKYMPKRKREPLVAAYAA